ncbi:MAG TPA: sulfotransferase [Pirellulales bacterium]|nr:sulfotransferase [Pirellulales bacterium]
MFRTKPRTRVSRNDVARVSSSAPHPCTPGFIAIGPSRTGTTWLHGLLAHRACVPRERKETRYFDILYARGPQWHSFYFRHCDGTRPVGEVSPTYFGSEAARDRIVRDLPRCKIICTLREPAARAWSQYRKMQRSGLVRNGLEEELRTNELLRESSRYGTHLAAWIECFGARNVGIFFYDDLQADPQRFADSVFAFLGLNPLELTPDVIRYLDRNEVPVAAPIRTLAAGVTRLRLWLHGHQAYRTSAALERAGVWRLRTRNGPRFAPLAPEVEARVRELLRHEVEEVERLTGRDLSAWKEPAVDHEEPPARRAVTMNEMIKPRQMD